MKSGGKTNEIENTKWFDDMKDPKILAIDDNADNIVVLKALMGEAFPEAIFVSALSGKNGI